MCGKWVSQLYQNKKINKENNFKKSAALKSNLNARINIVLKLISIGVNTYKYFLLPL